MAKLIERMSESEFWHDLQLVKGDINKALEVFYAFTGLNAVASREKGVVGALNRQALFWNTLVYSLQTTLFIVVGRIFDHSAHSIQKVVAATVQNPQIFARPALTNRKLAIGPEHPWLDDFIASAHEPAIQELQDLEQALSVWTEKYNTVYRPLRSKVFAHRVLKNDVDVQRLAGVVQIPEMEALLLFVYNLAVTLEEMYLNGAKPVVADLPFVDRSPIEQGAEETLLKLTAAYGP